jgi:predicted nucleic acid-binding Zn ribbon protein
MTSRRAVPTTPRRVGESLDRVTGALGVPSSSTLQVVFSSWDELVGDVLAAHARPASLRDGTLLVTVDDPSWATQLRWFQADLLQRLTAAVGEGAIIEIDVRVARG